VGSKGWFEGQGFDHQVASDAIAFTAWSDRIAVLEAKPTTLTSAETAEMADLKDKRTKFMARNTVTTGSAAGAVANPNDHLLAVQSAYTLMGTARDEEVGWQGGRSAEDVLSGDMTAASWEATYTNIWNDAFAGAGAPINQQEWVEPPVVPTAAPAFGPPR